MADPHLLERLVVDFTDAEQNDKGNVIPLSKTQQNYNLQHQRWLEKERLKHETMLLKAKIDEQKNQAREERKKERERNRLKQAQLQITLIQNLNRFMNIESLPVSPDIYPAMWEDEKGNRSPIALNEKDKTCKDISWIYVKAGIARYSYALSVFVKDYYWGDAQINSCLELWKTHTDTRPKPKAWSFMSDPEYTYNRLPWDLDRNIPTPFWDALTKRMSDPMTFKMWVGSLFFEKAYRQQYLYIQGDGGDGKGCISRFLEKIFAHEYFGLQEPPKNQFFGTAFEDKKIVCFTDLRKPEFLQSSTVMGITGGDTLQLEKKYKDIGNKKVLARILFLSNLPPVVSMTAHDLRRILYILIEKLPEEDRFADSSEYETCLFTEGPGFLAQCIELYKESYPNHGPLKQSDAILESIRHMAVDPLGDEMEDFAYENFHFYPKLPGQKTTDRCFVTAETIKRMALIQWPKSTDNFLGIFKKWVIENRGVEYAHKYMGTYGKPRVYFGMGLKNGVKTDRNEWQFIGW